jgi:hypothetical protein
MKGTRNMTAPDITDLDDEGVIIPPAWSYKVFRCESCGEAHIVLFDDAQKPITELIIGPEEFDELVKQVYEALDEDEEEHNDHQLTRN